MADTGDLLLFRGSQFGSKITRSFTGSNFDHVAMCLKFESDPDEIYYVDATSNCGVAISKWSNTRKYIGEFYEQIMLRHLEFERSDELIDRLEIFLKEAVGHKYGLSTSKLLYSRPSLKPKEATYIEDGRTFFCSELIAKAYKSLGISNDDRSSSSFFPSTFSAKGGLKLVEGAKLSPEFLIVPNPVQKGDVESDEETKGKLNK